MATARKTKVARSNAGKRRTSKAATRKNKVSQLKASGERMVVLKPEFVEDLKKVFAAARPEVICTLERRALP